jgi:hypothetical protein
MRKWMIAICFWGMILIVCVPAAGIKEKATGIVFETTSEVPGPDGNIMMDCTGAGVRKKWFVKVYACGFYMDSEYKSKLAAKWKARFPTVKKLYKQDGFFNELVNDKYCHKFVLKFVRDVGGEKIGESFYDGIEENLPEISSNTGLQEAAATFVKLFDSDIKENDTIQLILFPDGKIEARQNERILGSVEHPRLGVGLTAIYLGEECISDDLKEDLISLIYN